MAQNAKYEAPGNQRHGELSIASDTSSHTLIAASGSAGYYIDLTQLEITNGSNTNTVLTISDGTNNYNYALAPLGGVISKPGEYPKLAASANTAWTAQLSVSANVYINA
ncbi:MAG: hypothetical protein ACHP65_10040, partial [Legionellales bacterium]